MNLAQKIVAHVGLQNVPEISSFETRSLESLEEEGGLRPVLWTREQVELDRRGSPVLLLRKPQGKREVPRTLSV
jgi:hypothetical protein